MFLDVSRSADSVAWVKEHTCVGPEKDGGPQGPGWWNHALAVHEEVDAGFHTAGGTAAHMVYCETQHQSDNEIQFYFSLQYKPVRSV